MATVWPPWFILDRVARMWAADEHPEVEDFSIALAPPASLSTLNVPSWIHGVNDEDGALRPYVVAADRAGRILLHLNRPPFEDDALYPNPPGSLFVLSEFKLVHGDGDGEQNHHSHTHTIMAYDVRRVPDPLRPAVDRIINVRHLGLVTLWGSRGEDYIIAELDFVSPDIARLLFFRSGATQWVEREATASGLPDAWVEKDFQDVVSKHGEIWWINLEWGFLCWAYDEPELLYIMSPDREGYLRLPEDIRWNRMVRVSQRWLRYVEVTDTKVVMWTLVQYGDGGIIKKWNQEYDVGLVPIWQSESYRATGMPEEMPSLAAVHPFKPKLLYFFLGDYFFGLNVEEKVVEFVTRPYYDLVQVVDGLPSPLSWRYVLPWVLPRSLSQELDNPYEAPPAEGCGSASKCALA